MHRGRFAARSPQCAATAACGLKTLLQLVLRCSARRWYKGETAIPAPAACVRDAGLRYGAKRVPTIHGGCVRPCHGAGLPQNVLGSFLMNKTDLINAIADKAELTKADAGRALEAFFEVVQKSLKKGEDVSVVGFGTFTVRKRAARTGRNPRTNETIKIKASKVPAFKAGKTLKDALN
jgi:DNA-binding protein HU-beta